MSSSASSSSSASPRKKRVPPPKLSLSTLLSSSSSSTAPPKRRTHPLSLIDSHIHLWTRAQFRSGNAVWQHEHEHDHHESSNANANANVIAPQLKQECSLVHFGQAAQGGVGKLGDGDGETRTRLEGAIFVQAEAPHDDTDEDGTRGGWDGGIEEIDHVCRAALESPEIPLLAIVPWAPVHQGPKALSSYFTRLRSLPSLIALTSRSASPSVSGSALGLITSCRYLLQTSPSGFLLSKKFITGLQWLGEQGMAFDLTVDSVKQHGVLEEVIDCVQRVRDGQGADETKWTRIIVDHFAKPPLHLAPSIPAPKAQTEYITSLFSLSLLSNVSLKLSGLLDCAEPGLVASAFAEFCSSSTSTSSTGQSKGPEKEEGTSMETLRKRVLVYLEPAIESFGDARILIGSDWPMFRAHTIPAPSSPTSDDDSRDERTEALAWAFEMELYRTALVALGLEGEALDAVFAGNARRVYHLCE